MPQTVAAVQSKMRRCSEVNLKFTQASDYCMGGASLGVGGGG